MLLIIDKTVILVNLRIKAGTTVYYELSSMVAKKHYVEWVRDQLLKAGTEQKAEKIRHYFPEGIVTSGAMAGDVTTIIKAFHTQNADLSPDTVLAISEAILKNAYHSEEIMVAFGLLNKLVKRNYDDDLLSRFEFWLEHYASNWGHVDDLCIKTIYQFFLSRTHLIASIQPWSTSSVSWCRRASNVAWVKFIKRPIGSQIYYLDTSLVFENCNRLLFDGDVFVQKSVGWLLKVTSLHHQTEVLDYLRANAQVMQRPTLRYALEKVDKASRLSIMSLANNS